MKKTVRFLGLFAFAAIIGFTLTTCNNDAASAGSGTITISIGSSTGAAVSASGWTLGVAPNLLAHTITIIDGEGIRHEQTGVRYGSVVSFAVAGGPSLIGVWAFYGGDVVAYGYTTYNVTPGRSAVPIHMGTPEGAPPVGQPGPRTTPDTPPHNWGVWVLHATGTPWSSYERRTCITCGTTEERPGAATPGLVYAGIGGGWSVSNGTVTSGAVVIPHYYRLTASDPYLPVTTIADFAFQGIAITSVTIPASVTSIGNLAFANNWSLGTVTFAPGSMLQTIGMGAFGASGLTSIEIPASVISIGVDAFMFSINLGTVIFAPGSTLQTIGDSAFHNSGLTSITIPASVTSIGNSAFMDTTSLGTVTFAPGSTLQTIGDSAFHTSGLTSITIPASVTSIGGWAFNNNPLISITILGAGVTLGINAIGFGFEALYLIHGAGTYIRPNTASPWTYSP